MSSGLSQSGSLKASRGYQAFTYRAGMGLIPTAEFVSFFDDFVQPVATNLPFGWATVGTIDVGATAVLATAVPAGSTGAIIIASDGASEGVTVLGSKALQPVAGKKFFIETRVQTTLAAETDVQFGLTDQTATANPEDAWTTTAASLIAFGTLAGSALTKMLSDKSNSGSTAETGTRSLVNNTYATLGIYYDGTKLFGFVDGKQSVAWSQAATTIPTGIVLSPFFGARTGATAGNTTTLDYFRYVMER